VRAEGGLSTRAVEAYASARVKVLTFVYLCCVVTTVVLIVIVVRMFTAI
jgi:hypothetical protein